MRRGPKRVVVVSGEGRLVVAFVETVFVVVGGHVLLAESIRVGKSVLDLAIIDLGMAENDAGGDAFYGRLPVLSGVSADPVSAIPAVAVRAIPIGVAQR